MAFVAGISTAYVAGRFQRRRRHVPAPASEGGPITPEPEPPPPIRQLRRAHIRSFTDRAEKVPSDTELMRQAYSIDVPGGIVIGRRPDGTPAEVRLPGLNLGLTGPGVHDVVRTWSSTSFARPVTSAPK